ncbi:hypothetical protein SHIRM173S_11738 [Streptomyces hirsutus]
MFVRIVEGAEACTWLQKQVRDASGPVARELQFPYHPHVTVAHGIEEAVMDRAFEELADYEARWPCTDSRSTNRVPTGCGASCGKSRRLAGGVPQLGRADLGSVTAYDQGRGPQTGSRRNTARGRCRSTDITTRSRPGTHTVSARRRSPSSHRCSRPPPGWWRAAPRGRRPSGAWTRSLVHHDDVRARAVQRVAEALGEGVQAGLAGAVDEVRAAGPLAGDGRNITVRQPCPWFWRAPAHTRPEETAPV